MGQRLIFLVFAGFELLSLEPADGGLAGLGVKFELLELHFTLVDRVFGIGHGFLVVGQFGAGPSFLLRQFFQILSKGDETPIKILKGQKGAYFFEHDFWLSCAWRRGKSSV